MGRQEFDGFQKTAGVGPRVIPHDRKDHGVAGLLFRVAEMTARPPGDGVPPVERDDEKFERA